MTWPLCLIIVAWNSDAADATPTLCPESLKRRGGAGHAVVSEDEPGTEDWLSEYVQHSIADDLAVDSDKSATIGNTPDAMKC